jgi:hypothetical protein
MAVAVSNNGAVVTDYVIQYRRKGTTAWTTFPDAWSATRSRTVTGLTAGITYQFQVAARNFRGAGGYSAVVEAQTGL